jgi:hypothetical protein
MIFTLQPLLPKERIPGTHSTGGWVGPRTSWAVSKQRKISCPCQDFNPKTSSSSYHCYNKQDNPMHIFHNKVAVVTEVQGRFPFRSYSGNNARGGKHILTHHGPLYNTCILRIRLPCIKYFIHDTSKCTFHIHKYNFMSLPHVMASFMPSSGRSVPRFKTY